MENDLYRFIADRDTKIIDSIERYCITHNKERLDVIRTTFYFLETIKKKLDDSFMDVCVGRILENATENEKKAFSKPYSKMIYTGEYGKHLKSALKRIEKGNGDITELMFCLLNSKKTESEKVLALMESTLHAKNELYIFMLTSLYTSEDSGTPINYINHVGDKVTHIYTRAEFIVDWDIINAEYDRMTPGNIRQGTKAVSPSILDMEKGRMYIDKAIHGNLAEIKNNKLVWKGTKQLLAYFGERLSKELELSKRRDKDGNIMVNWKATEDSFNITNLKSAKNDWMKHYTRFTPNGCDIIDAFFND